MRRPSTLWCVGALLLAWLLPPAHAQPAKPPATVAELQQRLADQVAQPQFAAGALGVKVVSLESGQTIFEHNAAKLLSPASNSKLYTVALALDQLGGDYRLKTSLYAEGRPNQSGTLKGDLIVYGRGDPTLNARLNGGDIFKALEPLVAALTNAGVKRIRGDLIGDDSFIRGTPYGSGWDADDLQSYYGAEISALTINDNVVQLSVKPAEHEGDACKLALSPATTCLILSNRTETVAKDGRRSITFHRPLGENVVYVFGQMPLGSTNFTDDVTMHNPAGLFIALFKEALARHGIKVGGKLRTMNWLDRQAKPVDFEKLVELGSVESLPLRDLAREIMKPSQNLYTDLILAHVGALAQERRAPSRRERGNGFQPAEAVPGAPQTSEDAGIRELGTFLAKAGVGQGDVHIEEGSGLSRNNLTTPNATIALLKFMSRHPEADAYLNSLPIAGVDGTLRNRMKGTPAAGNVRAKTGTLRWANALSGHVTTAAGERLIFSIMLNRYAAPDAQHSGRVEIDKIAVMLAEFTGRSN
ncbi:MAG TPA: D-alanyl-D-alanine carboxypeptidase/D-alanyl-D-alanine-endopeptidase [Verrucomicrobiae bacterium]|nr:D-alanyl-D-alanine carboxypeptidase/D-alanyl-D-alanine-endopeptidase [Verrucomicrobiae bacterium]